MKSFLKAMKNYVKFSGRTSRKDYWLFVLFSIIFGAVFIALDNAMGIDITGMKEMTGFGYGYFYLIYTLAILLPSLAIFVRRMHDVGKKGAMIFVFLIPAVGAIWLLVLLIKAGDEGDNKFGPKPAVEE